MARQANSLSGLTSDQVCPTNLVINIHCWEVNISVFVDIFLHIWPLYNCSIMVLNDAFTDTLSGCTWMVIAVLDRLYPEEQAQVRCGILINWMVCAQCTSPSRSSCQQASSPKWPFPNVPHPILYRTMFSWKCTTTPLSYSLLSVSVTPRPVPLRIKINFTCTLPSANTLSWAAEDITSTAASEHHLPIPAVFM